MYKRIFGTWTLAVSIILLGLTACSSSGTVEVVEENQSKYFHINDFQVDGSNIYLIYSAVDSSEYPTAGSKCGEKESDAILDSYIKIVLNAEGIISGELLLPEGGSRCSLSLSFAGDKVTFALGGNTRSLSYIYDESSETFTVIVPQEPEEEDLDACVTYGEAGSCIFHDKGEESFGWRYLEVAPSNTMAMKTWDVELPFEETFAVDQDVGMGKEMTDMIVGALGTSNTYAAGYCDALEVERNGTTYDDWFLPSKLELELMYTNLHREGYGDFNICGYWSSSEDGIATDKAYSIDFIGGGSGSSQNKSTEHCVRCVRFAN